MGLSQKIFRSHKCCSILLFELDEFESARDAFQQGLQLDPDNTRFKTWLRKCAAELKEPSSAVPVTVPQPAAAPAVTAASAPAASAPAAAAAATSDAPQAVRPPVSSATGAPRIRHEWYQTATNVVVTVFAKNVKRDDVRVRFDERAACGL